jgi:16S rRNA (cytosine967-C5)-methyltransferase
MTPAARIEAVIEILSQSHLSRVPLDSVVGDYMRVRRYVGAKDRSNVAERVYEVMRANARLGWWLDFLTLEDTPRTRMLLWCALGEGADAKRLKDLFDGSKHGPAELSALELEIINKIAGKELNNPAMPRAVLAECPEGYAAGLQALWGDAFEAEMAAMLKPATLDLRTNIFLATREKAKAFLEADGVTTVETPYSPWGLRCEKKAFLSKTKAFHKGWIEIQDEGSQLIAYACDAQPGMQVLDYCAGAGGKTLALAAAMNRKGRIVAMDNDDRRLAKGRERYKKAQLADIIEVRPLSDDKNRKWLRRQSGKFDVVLCDVPCSGSGTWRRNPDMRWRTYGPTLEELTALQAEILDKVAPAVKPGGKLVYATCSLFPEENEKQVEAFLSRHEGFEIAPVDARLGNPFMRLTPLKHNTDGFFAAVLRKKEI